MKKKQWINAKDTHHLDESCDRLLRILNLADVDNYPKVRKLFETARIRIRPAEDK